MKKILLVCSFFAPENEIASVRLTKFAKYLLRKGYLVDVLVPKKFLRVKDGILMDDAKNVSVHYIENSKWMRKISGCYDALTKNYREKKYHDRCNRLKLNSEKNLYAFSSFQIAYPILGSVDLLMTILKEFDLSVNSRRFLKMNKDEYDVCFSTYGKYFGHFVGRYFKKINKKIMWIADFRDPVYNIKFVPKYVKGLTRWYEEYVYKNCDMITVVTKKMKELVPNKYKQKVRCIYNGYDLEDKDKVLVNRRFGDNKFSFCYTGRMYGGLRNLSVLFEVLRELIDENKIDKNDIEIRYAGTGYTVFEEQAKMSGMLSYCKNYGFVPRDKSLILQAKSTFLLFSGWDYKEEPNYTIVAKFYEYMLFHKPMIAIINGDLETSEMADIMNKARAGCVYMEFNNETDRGKLKQYISEQYLLFKSEGQVRFNPNQEVLALFNYEHLTHELICLISDYQNNTKKDERKIR